MIRVHYDPGGGRSASLNWKVVNQGAFREQKSIGTKLAKILDLSRPRAPD
jgi:hypothetical protein